MPPQPTAEKWSAKQEQVALLLASGWSVRGAAKEARAGERTVYDWMATPDYRAFIAELRGRLFGQTVGLLANATNQAAMTLAKLLNDASSNIRLRAAIAIIDCSVRLRDHVEIDERIRTIEENPRLSDG